MVVCGIQVENWTKFPLTNPNTTLEWGYLSSPATNIQPATREAMVYDIHDNEYRNKIYMYRI